MDGEKFANILKGKGKAGLLNSDIQLAAFRHLAVSFVLRTGRRVQHEIGTKGVPANLAWNLCMMDLVQASKVKQFQECCSLVF